MRPTQWFCALCLVALGLLIPGCGDDPVAPVAQYPVVSTFDDGAALSWGTLALELTKGTAGFSPPVASRAFGYLGLGLYEALVPGMPGHQSLALQLNGLDPLPAPEYGDGYHWPSVANSTLATLARYLYASTTPALLAEITALEDSLTAQFATQIDAGLLSRSTARGRTVADAIYIYSLTDGGHQGYTRNFPSSYVPPVGPGLWVPTPPLNQSALQPYWGANRSFALPLGDPNALCDPGPPPAFSTDPASAFYQEANEVYVTVNNLTAVQDVIARFWADDPGLSETPPGHSLSILMQVCRLENVDLAVAAEAFARVGIAVADAFIACWQSKYEYNLLRPITYIRDHVDASWSPLLNTPPFPEYTSGHSVQSGAAFAVLEALFGSSYAFTDHTHDARGLAPRSFTSFAAAADEAAVSRLYGGIHFRAAIARGVDQGRCIGDYVNALQFRKPGL